MKLALPGCITLFYLLYLSKAAVARQT